MDISTEYNLGRAIRFDAATGELIGAEQVIKLEPKAADVLALLCREGGRLVPRARLLDQCWGSGAGSDEALTQTVAQIRRALQALNAPADTLITYPKRGYRLSREGAPHAHRGKSTAVPAWVPLSALLIACVLILAFAPGWPRHAIRHALGFGPTHARTHSATQQSQK